jgi:C4-dicarboxylate transporter DctQ subunit
MLKKIDRFVSGFSTAVMTVCMSVATIVAFINVVMRYAFGSSLTWAGHLTEYLFIWSALFGAAYGFKIGMHIGVTAIIENLPAKFARVLLTINLILMIVFLVAMTKWGIDFINFSMNFEQIDVELRIPFWTIYLCVPISLTIATYELLLKLVRVIRMPSDQFSYDAVMKND